MFTYKYTKNKKYKRVLKKVSRETNITGETKTLKNNENISDNEMEYLRKVLPDSLHYLLYIKNEIYGENPL
mgnify:CR=1 FL=1